ncbi:MAG: HisA/HisF-related TIM barrel protein, partial [Acidimicrobiia bacterium]
MLLYPAIDLRDGRAVRLRQGDFAQSTVFSEDPIAQAREFAEDGARCLHVVDLDGALDGAPAQAAL